MRDTKPKLDTDLSSHRAGVCVGFQVHRLADYVALYCHCTDNAGNPDLHARTVYLDHTMLVELHRALSLAERDIANNEPALSGLGTVIFKNPAFPRT